MFPFCKKTEASTGVSRIAEIGWVLDTQKAGFIWDAPRRLTRPTGKATHAKGVTFCPAVHDHDARIFEIACPIDAEIGLRMKDGQPMLVNLGGDQSSVRTKHLGQMCVVVDPKEWRHPQRPIVQFMTPYVFLADEPVWITQTAPYYHYLSIPWPGLLIGGRFPIHIWPRGLVWAFEWYEPGKPLVLKRGEPWFYASFETGDPARRVRMVEAELTPQLQEYMNGIKGVTNYVSRTFSLFSTARQRRPKTLLVPKQR